MKSCLEFYSFCSFFLPSLPPSLSKVVEDGYEFFARRQLVTLFSAPNYCGDYDNAGGMMTIDENLMCSFQVTDTFCLFLSTNLFSELKFFERILL